MQVVVEGGRAHQGLHPFGLSGGADVHLGAVTNSGQVFSQALDPGVGVGWGAGCLVDQCLGCFCGSSGRCAGSFGIHVGVCGSVAGVGELGFQALEHSAGFLGLGLGALYPLPMDVQPFLQASGYLEGYPWDAADHAGGAVPGGAGFAHGFLLGGVGGRERFLEDS